MAVAKKSTILWDVTLVTRLHGKRTAIPVAVWTALGGSRKLGFPDFKTIDNENGKVVKPVDS
jgi:hypothetical protein